MIQVTYKSFDTYLQALLNRARRMKERNIAVEVLLREIKNTHNNFIETGEINIDESAVDLEREKFEEKIKSYEELVKDVLENNERARNDDLYLYLLIWQQKQYIDVLIPNEEMYRMIRPETISRIRRKFNEQGLLLPTDPLVAVKRKIRESLIKQYFGNNKWYMSEWNKKTYGVK